MKKILLLASVFFAGLFLHAGVSLAAPDECHGKNDACSVPGPADSETGLAGVVMAGGAAYLVWRRRKAPKA